MKQMDVPAQEECESTINRIADLINCGIFEKQNSKHILRHSAFIELMICLKDLLEKARIYAKRISFTDDIMTNEYVTDVHDAVTAMRDACCHINSFKRHLGKPEYTGSFLWIYGSGGLAKSGDVELRSDHSDDMAFFHGTNRLYMRRHIIRAFEEAKAQLLPLLPKDPSTDT
jgi:hypothetical protein